MGQLSRLECVCRTEAAPPSPSQMRDWNMRIRQIHDTSHWLALAVVRLVGHVFRDEEKHDLYSEVYAAAKEAIERHEAALQLEQRRLHPLLKPSEN